MSGPVLGCISGRFQPFHNDHLAYALATLERVELLYVGITNADPSHVEADAAGGHRHLESSNPFRFHERAEMIRAALRGADVTAERFRIVPCPINRPELIRHYVPAQATHWVTLYEEEPWGSRKLDLLRGAGLLAEVLWDRPGKNMTSTQIRERLRRGEGVEDLVPAPVAELLTTIPDLVERLGD